MDQSGTDTFNPPTAPPPPPPFDEAIEIMQIERNEPQAPVIYIEEFEEYDIEEHSEAPPSYVEVIEQMETEQVGSQQVESGQIETEQEAEDSSTFVNCPRCFAFAPPRKTKKPGTQTRVLAFILCTSITCIPCACLLLTIDYCRGEKLYCQVCNKYLGRS